MAHESTTILLRNVPLTKDYADTLVFASVSEQTSYFRSKQAYAFSELMYVRKNEIYLPNTAGQYRTCNYMMYTNPDYPNKWFYAFITSVEYMSDGTTRIIYVDDWMQTWYFEMEVKQSIVVREHVNDDTPGKHLKAEGLALGEYVVSEETHADFDEWWIVVVSSVGLEDASSFPPAEGAIIQGVYSGLEYRAYAPNHINAIQQILDNLAADGKSEAIVSMYMVPRWALSNSMASGDPVSPSTVSHFFYPPLGNNSLDGYTPKNNKLYTYPYQGLKIGNKSGNNVILAYEFYTGSGGFTFQYDCNTMPGGKIILYPTSYKGQENNMDYSLALGDYPQCAWLKDVFANWLATQDVKYGYEKDRRYSAYSYSYDMGGLKTLTKALTGDVGGAISEGLNTLSMNPQYEFDVAMAKSVYAEEYEIHEMIPPSASGSIGNSASLMAIGKYGFTAQKITVTAEFAKSIDQFFSLFGYKVDEVKRPNIFGRQSWNFVQTLGAIVTGTAPSFAIESFKAALDKGIRFWHTDDIGNYDLPNGIVGG